MKQFYGLLTALFLAVFSQPGLSSPPVSSNTLDWSKVSENARRTGHPVLMIFSSNECAYCEMLRSRVLAPAQHDGHLSGIVHIHEFNIDTGGKITDFDGDRIRSRMFVRRYKVFATPTVIIVDQNGNPISKPIIGYDGSQDYVKRLDKAIHDAVLTHALKETPRLTTLNKGSGLQSSGHIE